MGSKNHPGKFDCYQAADPNEPMFVLLGRDQDAPGLVYQWAALREQRGELQAKVDEARNCANEMILYRQARRVAPEYAAFQKLREAALAITSHDGAHALAMAACDYAATQIDNLRDDHPLRRKLK
jgi:hypothetical protein